jgi:hypothetical protein
MRHFEGERVGGIIIGNGSQEKTCKRVKLMKRDPDSVKWCVLVSTV